MAHAIVDFTDYGSLASTSFPRMHENEDDAPEQETDLNDKTLFV